MARTMITLKNASPKPKTATMLASMPRNFFAIFPAIVSPPHRAWDENAPASIDSNTRRVSDYTRCRLRRLGARACGFASRQNQDLRDYRIFRIRSSRVFDGQSFTHIRFYPPSFPRRRESRGGEGLAGLASCQNQDLRDYRIFRILQARIFDGQASTHILFGGDFMLW